MANIAILLQEYYPADVRVRKETHVLCQNGHSIDLFCLKRKDEKPFEVIDGVRVCRTEVSKKRGSKLNYIFEYFVFFLRARAWLRKLTQQKKIDIVHIHNLPDFLVFAAKPARKKGAKVILDMHEITPEFFMSKYKVGEKNLLIRMLKWVECKSLEYADYVITINEQIKKRFSQRAALKNEIVVIMNTVNDSEWPLLPAKKKEKTIAIYHGTLTELYNLEFAISAISKITDKLVDFEFHIYGDGTQYDHLISVTSKLSLNSIVFFHGKVDYKLIPSILSNADLGILPIRKDVMTDLSFSNKLGEYVHYNIPVLSTNLAGMMEYFPPDSAFYYKNNDENDFNEKLLGILSDRENSIKVAHRASELYKEINWDVMRSRLIKMYQILIPL